MSYKNTPGISQSFLKKLATNPYEAKHKLYDDDSKPFYLKFGTMLDKMLKSEADFNEHYAVINSTPSDAVTAIIVDYYNETKDFTLENEEKLMTIGKSHQYSLHIKKPETYLNRLKNVETLSYIAEYHNSQGKTVISADEKTKINNLVNAFKDEPSTSFYVAPTTDNFYILDDLVIKFEYKGYTCKCEIDRIIINKSNQVIIPIDFKSTSSVGTNSFSYSFFKFGYHNQDFFYSTALKYAVENNFTVTTKDIYGESSIFDLSGYQIEDFIFLTGETGDLENPTVYAVKSNQLIREAGKSGFIAKNGNKYEGIDQLLNRYEFHETYGYSKYPMEYVQKGYLDLQLI